MSKLFIIPKFLKNRFGGIAPIFAIALIPIMMSAGAAIDYSRKENDSKTMQNAADAAVLAGGAKLDTMNKRQIKQLVRKFVHANIDSRLSSQIASIKPIVNKRDHEISLTIRGKTPSTMLKIIGITDLEYKVFAASKSATGSLEVVLVLDNTYSMSVQNKLVDLKTASKNFVNKLMAKNAGRKTIKIGIVPFAQYVNVGIDNRHANWMNVPNDSSSTTRQCYDHSPVLTTFNCRPVTYYNDGVPNTYRQCDHTYGPSVRICRNVTNTTRWNGCVGSRIAPYNLQDTRPDVRFPGLMNTSCPSRLTELTYNKTKLLREIRAMRATGETYIPTGLMWGLRVISSSSPFKQGVSYQNAITNNVKKVIVLMTDGENQRSAQLPSPTHWGSNLPEANSWTTLACNQIKNKDIALYSVTFGSSIQTDARNLIRNCATDPTKYFHAASGNELSSAFDSIIGDLNKLRLTH